MSTQVMGGWTEFVEIKLEIPDGHSPVYETVTAQSDHSYCKKTKLPKEDIQVKEEWLDDVVMKEEIDESPDTSTTSATLLPASCLVPCNPCGGNESAPEEASEEDHNSSNGSVFGSTKSRRKKGNLLMEEPGNSDSEHELVDPYDSDDPDIPAFERNGLEENGSDEDEVTDDSDDSNDSQHSAEYEGPTLGDWLLKNAPKPVKKGRVRKKRNFKWKKKPFKFNVSIPERNYAESIDEPSSPMYYFKKFFTDELLRMVVHECNRYREKEKFTVNDLRNFLSIEITMGCIKVENKKSYWAWKTKIPRVADVMSSNKYERVRSSLHFVDNEDPLDPNDTYHKIRPIAEYLRLKFKDIKGVDRKFSIDEMWIPYRAKSANQWPRRMSIKTKKWGFKMYARSGVSGIIYDYFLHAGEQSFDQVAFEGWEIEEKFPARCVLALCQSIEAPALSVVFLNGFFSSLRLISLLRYEYGILSIGVLEPDELDGADRILASDEELLERGRGAFDRVSDNRNKVTIVKWADKEVLTLASSFVGVEPLGRASETISDKKINHIHCPRIVKEYKSFMSGGDALSKIYKTPLRTFKWYMAIFSHLLNLTLANAWILHSRENPENKMSFFDFRLSVSNDLMVLPERIKATKLPNPSNERRLDGADHFPLCTTRGRCRFCKLCQITFECSKCRMRLCIRPNRNCFLEYHTLRTLPERGTYTRRINKKKKLNLTQRIEELNRKQKEREEKMARSKTEFR